MTQREKESIEWYRNVLKKTVGKKYSESYNKKRRRIQPGEIIHFEYKNPKTRDKLKWWDAHPLSIIFRMNDRKIWGINLHYVPIPMRKLLIQKVIKLNKLRIKSNMRFTLQWNDIKEFLYRNGLAELMTKSYITNRITDLDYVKYEDWYYVIHLRSEQFIFNGDYSIEDILAMVRRSQKKTKKSKNKRFGR